MPTGRRERAEESRAPRGKAATERLHLFEFDYTTSAGAESLVATMVERLGGVDDVVTSIDGWWHGKQLWEIDEADWQVAFVALATAHMAVQRAARPRMTDQGANSVVVGRSARFQSPAAGWSAWGRSRS